MTEVPQLSWTEQNTVRAAFWRSENHSPPPRRVVLADDALSAAAAWRLISEGTAILWRGDYHNARQLLQAIKRKLDQKPYKPGATLTESFHLHRMAQAQKARALGMLLLNFEADHRILLRRAPDVRQACQEAYGEVGGPYVASLRELLGLIGAHEWRKKGVFVPALEDRVHPYYGVFAPIRGEYVGLVASASLSTPRPGIAFDVGTGTGVLAAVLARRGVGRVVATDCSPQARACATENIARLDLGDRVCVVEADLFPEGRADLVVCNPPWLPGRVSSRLEAAVYDPESQMLKKFLAGLADHLTANGEGWLVISDLAERLGLRPLDMLEKLIQGGGLRVVERLEVRPSHPKATDTEDALHAARGAEITFLFRLKTI